MNQPWMSRSQVMFFIFFIKFYILSYVSVCLCTCECRCQSGPEEGSESLGSGAVGICKPLQLIAGTWTWVLCKSWSALNCWAIFSSTKTVFLMSELYLYNKLVIPLILFLTNLLTWCVEASTYQSVYVEVRGSPVRVLSSLHLGPW